MGAEKERYYREIEIAQEALRKSKILCLSENKNPVCDVYCLVSTEHQTFYAQIYEDGEDFILLYAKTCVNGKDDVIKTLSFTECEKLLSCFAEDSRIICEAKRIPRSDRVFCRLLECLPVRDMWYEYDGLLIDGVKTVVRSFYKGEPCAVLGFRSEEDLDKKMYSAGQRRFLDNLYITFGEILSG